MASITIASANIGSAPTAAAVYFPPTGCSSSSQVECQRSHLSVSLHYEDVYINSLVTVKFGQESRFQSLIPFSECKTDFLCILFSPSPTTLATAETQSAPTAKLPREKCRVTSLRLLNPRNGRRPSQLLCSQSAENAVPEERGREERKTVPCILGITPHNNHSTPPLNIAHNFFPSPLPRSITVEPSEPQV